MKRLLAAAFLTAALLAGSGVGAQNLPTGDEPKDPPPDAPAAAPAAPAASEAKPTPPSAETLQRIEAAGYKAIKDPSTGDVLGYETADGKMCVMPNHPDILALMGNATPNPMAGTTAADAQEDVAKGAAQKEAAAQGRSPKPGDLDFVGPLEADFCAKNAGAPVCAKEKEEAKKEQDPKEVAEQQKEAASQQAFTASANGDAKGTAEAIKARNEAEDRAGDDGQGTAAGTNGTDIAFDGPGPGSSSSGGRDMGAQGQVSGSGKGGDTGGGLSGKRVRADADQEAAALIAFQQGMKNGPLDGPSDPNVQSVAQLSQRGLGGRALDAAKSLFSTITESLGAAADTPQTDLSDQLATSPIDGAAANRAPIKVVECRNDTLNGTAGGRTSRRVGGC